MTMQNTFNASRTLASMSDDILISENGGVVEVDPTVKTVYRKLKPRLVWTAPFEFMLDFHYAGNSPVEHGQYHFHSKPYQDGWRVVIMVKNVTYDTKLKYAVVSSFGTLDPAIIIDPN